jgi:hypothetical protein
MANAAARSVTGRADAWLRSSSSDHTEKIAIENDEREKKKEIRKQRHVLRLLPLSRVPLSLPPVASPPAAPPRPPPLPVVLHPLHLLLLQAPIPAAAQSANRARAAAIRTPIMNQTTTILGTRVGFVCSHSITA